MMGIVFLRSLGLIMPIFKKIDLTKCDISIGIKLLKSTLKTVTLLRLLHKNQKTSSSKMY